MTKTELAEELRIIGYAKKIIDKLEEENAELKRMLKLAVEDIDIAMNGDMCELCSDERCDFTTPRTWRHLDEAMKLIGEDKQ